MSASVVLDDTAVARAVPATPGASRAGTSLALVSIVVAGVLLRAWRMRG